MTLASGFADAPWGPIRIAANETGIVALEQLVTEEEFAARLERRFGAAALGGDAGQAAAATSAARLHLDRAIVALRLFIGGDHGALAAVPVDLRDRPAWDRFVLGAVRAIPPGATASYGDVARMAGRPGAARAVGGAVGRNPVGLVIPCHRVVAANGTLGGYGGGWWGGRDAGIALKRELLAREGVHLEPTRWRG